MKKITLLLSILCASALNGMEKPEYGHYTAPLLKNLPEDVQSIIIAYLHENLNLNDTIKNIKTISLINKELNKIINEMYGNPKGFKALIYMLANKFNESPGDVATAFNTPAAKEYFSLGDSLISAISNAAMQTLQKKKVDMSEFTELIDKGADVNYVFFTGDGDATSTPLFEALRYGGSKLIKLLLDNGANPHLKNQINLTALDYAKEEDDFLYTPKIDKDEIITLLEEAMEKPQKNQK